MSNATPAATPTPETPASTLVARKLCKSWHGRAVVQDVDLHVGSGEVVGLLGPNGAGKTTTFYMIVGMLRHDRGEVLLDDHAIGGQPMHRRARAGIGYLPQEPSVFRKLTVRDNILAILETRPRLDAAARRTALEALLARFNLESLQNARGFSLSGGERRRVEIARALALQPRFLLLDEPFSGIDPIAVGELQQMIRDLRDSGIGVLITDHNVRETLGICDRAYVLSEGKVLASGTPDELVRHEKVREGYLGNRFQL